MTAARSIGVLICDDHPVVRQGLRSFLASRPGLSVVGEANDGEEALRKARHLRPDVVLMDLSLPGIDGIEATRRIGALGAGIGVIILTSFADRDQVMPAIRAGASGYLLKDAEPSELEAAIRAVHRGDALLHPHAAGALVEAVTEARPAARLSAREQEVLSAIVEGLTNRQIARRLAITEKTVKAHVSSVLRKLGAADRTQAAVLAVRERLVDDPWTGGQGADLRSGSD